MKKTNGLVLLAGTAVFGAGVLVGYAAHSDKTYDIKKDETALSEEQKEKVCNQALEPLKNHFKKECSQKNIDNLYNGNLGAIVGRRNEVAAEYDCKPESWVCEPEHPGNYRTTFKARFRD